MFRALFDCHFSSVDDGFRATAGSDSKLVRTQEITSFSVGGFSKAFSSEPSEHFADRNRPDTTLGFSGGKEIRTAQPRRETRRGLPGSEDVNNPVERL